MPIISISGPEAVRIRKANKLASWGNRLEQNRVEPVAKPAFDVPITLKAGEPIFTIGSCFARNVETELIKRGFRIPMRELFETPEFEDLSPEIVNNFGTPSIYNELAWAFGEEPFDEDMAIVEVGQDRFIDLHMVRGVRPDVREKVLARRRGLLKATRALAESRVLIATLGLAEVWWDEEAQAYLNTGPLPSVLRKYPERFFLHVLDFEECRSYLDNALALAFKHGRDDLHVILTVSPVPIMATHRRQDVITANSYSKSLLRTVAEHVAAKFDRVIYFPSYESVTLSDRRVAWLDDMVHPTREIVNFNVERMVNAYMGRGDRSAEAVLPLPDDMGEETAESLHIAEQARQARLADDDSFFERIDPKKTSPAVALEVARHHLAQERPDDAIVLLEGVRSGPAAIVRSEAHLAREDFAAARESIEPLCRRGIKGLRQWQILAEATAKLSGADGLIEVERRWCEAFPRQRLTARVTVGRYLSDIGAHEEAIERLDAEHADERVPGWVPVFYARSMIALGAEREALTVLDAVEPRTPWQRRQIESLKKQAQGALSGQNG